MQSSTPSPAPLSASAPSSDIRTWLEESLKFYKEESNEIGRLLEEQKYTLLSHLLEIDLTDDMLKEYGIRAGRDRARILKGIKERVSSNQEKSINSTGLDVLPAEESYFSAIGKTEIELDDKDFSVIEYTTHNPFFGNAKQKSILERNAYLEIYTLIKKDIQNGITRFLILGNPGIGKSFFLFYLMEKLLKERITDTFVLNRRTDHKAYCYTTGKVTKSILHVNFDRELSKLTTWYLVDSISDPGEVNAITINVASPRIDNYREYRKYPNVVKYYMPVWSFKEIQFAAENCFFNKYNLEKTTKRFQKFGGIPRTLFSLDKLNSEIQSAICRTNLKHCINFLLQPDSPEGVSSCLTHIVPAKDYKSHQMHFASNKIGEMVIKKFVQDSETELCHWLESSSGMGTFGALRGIIFEQYAHNRLVEGGIFRIKDLYSGVIRTEEVFKSSHAFNVHSFEKKINKDTYYRPYSKRFGAIDSWKLELGLMQMTTSLEHPVSLLMIGPIMTRIPEDMKKRIVFVVPPDIFDSFKHQKPQIPPEPSSTNQPPSKKRCRQEEWNKLSDYEVMFNSWPQFAMEIPLQKGY